MSEMLQSYPTDFLLCRVFGHAWEEWIPVGMRAPEFGFRFSLLCTRCRTERHDTIDVLGAVGARRYIYAKGYEHLDADREDCRIELEKREDRKALPSKTARRGKLIKEIAA